MIADRTYLVGLDGSDLSWEALRLATRIMGPKDDVHALAIVKPGGAPDSLVADAEGILRGAGLLGAARGGAQFVVETEALKDGWTIAQQLIYAANHVNNRRGILVMGAAGGGAEGKAHPAGNPPMGSVARDALHRVKVPLVLVRGNPTRAPSKSDVASPPAAAASAAAAADGGAHARAPMTVAVCVDDDSVSDHAFDVAIRFCRPGDTLVALHVVDAERSGFGLLNRANGIDRLKAHYVAECSKHDDLDTRVSFVPKRGSVKDTLMSAVSDMKADMVILSALIWDGGRATAIATSRIPYVPISSA